MQIVKHIVKDSCDSRGCLEQAIDPLAEKNKSIRQTTQYILLTNERGLAIEDITKPIITNKH